MVDKLTNLINPLYNQMDDLFDWTYEFYKISDLIVSEEKYDKLKHKYNQHLDEKSSNEDDTDTETTEEDEEHTNSSFDENMFESDSDKESPPDDSDEYQNIWESFSDEDNENIKNNDTHNCLPVESSFIFQTQTSDDLLKRSKGKYIDDSGDSIKSSDSSILKSGESEGAYFITDFYFDVADLVDQNSDSSPASSDVVKLKEFFTQSTIRYFIVDYEI